MYLRWLPLISSALFTLGSNLFTVATYHVFFVFSFGADLLTVEGSYVLSAITAATVFLVIGLWGLSRSPRAFLIRSFSKERRQSTLDVLDYFTGQTIEKTSYSFNLTVLGLLASKYRVVRLLNVDAFERPPSLNSGYVGGVVFSIASSIGYLTELHYLSIGDAMTVTLPSLISVHLFLVWRSRPKAKKGNIIGLNLDQFFLSGRPKDSVLFHHKLNKLQNEVRKFSQEIAARSSMFGSRYIHNIPNTYSQVYCSEAHWPLVVETGLLTAAFCIVDVTEVYPGSATHQELVLLRKLEDEGRRSRLQTTFVCSSYDYERARQYCSCNFGIEGNEIISIDLTGSSGRSELEVRMDVALAKFWER